MLTVKYLCDKIVELIQNKRSVCMKNKAKLYFGLFLTMLKIGAFTFGGGYAMIALLENEFIAKKKWMEKEEFLDMVAIAESTPGPIAINSATYIGYKVCGVLGSLAATLGMVLPSFTIIFAISLFFDRFLSLSYVGYAFRGIQVCVIYLIFTAGLKLLKQMKKNMFNIVLLSSVIVAMILCSVFAVNFSTIFYILICGVLGLSVYLFGQLQKRGGDKQ